MSDTELLYLLTLQRIPDLGDISAKKLLKKLGSAEAVFKAKTSDLLKIDGIGKFKLKDLKDPAYFSEAESELNFIKNNDILVSYFEDKTYPQHLKQCIDAPILLFQKGNIDLQNKKIISIVGTRKITNLGVAFCDKLIEELAPLNPVIISGFAYGVDICAHKAAIHHNLQTIGCLAHGLDQIYPKAHARHKEQVENHGGFMTDFWSGAKFDRKNFLKRNRIIAGLSEATIVIESAEKGGSLVTADIANSYNREVFAVPGRPTDNLSKGCNTLIKTQQAQMITSAADLVYMLNWDVEKQQKPKQQQLFIDLEPEEEVIISHLRNMGKAELDVLALECGMPIYKLTSLLLNLELSGLIRPLPGKLYEVV